MGLMPPTGNGRQVRIQPSSQSRSWLLFDTQKRPDNPDHVLHLRYAMINLMGRVDRVTTIIPSSTEDPMHGIDMARVPTTIATRWASPENTGAIASGGGQANGGRKGAGNFSLDDGKSRVLASISGSCGTVRRIWITMWSLAGKDQETEARCLRGMRLRCWWDGAETPAVDVPLGDFFCQGLGRMSAFENAYFANPEGRSLVCFLPMPFRSSMRIELTNQTGCHQQWIFYDVDMTLGDRHEPDTCYLHAHWRREQRTVLGRDFELLPEVAGRGRFLGACISVIPDRSVYGRSWWGEGEAKMYLDDDGDHPTLCGTGTED